MSVSDPDPMVRVRVAATVPLLQAGLERAATTAGLCVVPDDEADVVTLRTSNQPTTSTPIDISVEHGRAQIAITAAPDTSTWSATLRLVRQLLDDS